MTTERINLWSIQPKLEHGEESALFKQKTKTIILFTGIIPAEKCLISNINIILEHALDSISTLFVQELLNV